MSYRVAQVGTRYGILLDNVVLRTFSKLTDAYRWMAEMVEAERRGS